MDSRIEDIMEWTKTSSFVCDSNSELDIYLLDYHSKGRLRSGQVVNLAEWLQGLSLESDDIFQISRKLGGYYLSAASHFYGGLVNLLILERVKRITKSEDTERSELDKLRSDLTHFKQISTDPNHAIKPTDGILAYEDQRTGLVWDTGRIFVSHDSNSPEDMSPLLNDVSYAGYNDWRVATKFDLYTIFSNRAPHVIKPLSLVAPMKCWSSFSKFHHKFKNRDYFETRTGLWCHDFYYKSADMIKAGFLYVRGEVKVSGHEWLNELAHWLSVNDLIPDRYGAKNFLSVESTLFQMKSLRVFCHHWEVAPVLPTHLTLLEKLEELGFDSSQSTMQSTSVDFDLITSIGSLKYLSLTSNTITAIPECIQKLKLLEVLNLEDNSIEYLPDEISELNLLKSIDLSRNRLALLAEGILSLQCLQRLNLESNRLSSISQINRLLALKSLNLRGNKLVSIPKTIDELQNLESLDISHNKIERLPSEICNLHSLSSLKISGNPLVCLPEDIGNLINLEELDLSSTKLVRLPQSIANLKRLKILYLDFPGQPEREIRTILRLTPVQLNWIRELIEFNNCRVNMSLREILERN